MPYLVRQDEQGFPIYDFSDDIARLQALILLLHDVAPGGAWLHLPIYQRWVVRADRATVRYTELLELTAQLEHTLKIALYRGQTIR